MKRHPLSIVVLVIALAAGLAAAPAGALEAPSIHLVPWQAAEFFISDADLGDDPASSPAWIVSPTGFGSLEAVAGGWVYRPTPQFWDSGIDTFYWDDGTQPPAGSPHYLVANLQREPWSDMMDPSCQASPDWTLQGDLTRVRWFADPNGCGMEITLGADPIFRRAPPAETGPGGGNTTITLDTGEVLYPDQQQRWNAPLSVAAGVLLDGRPVFELVLVSSREMFVRAHHDDGVAVESPTVMVAGGASVVQLEWWFESAPGAADGGLVLVHGGQPLARVEGLSNHGLLGEPWSWEVGTLGSSAEMVGQIAYADVEVWTSPRTPILDPIVSRTAGGDALARWDQLLSPQQLSDETHLADPKRRFRIEAPDSGSAGFIDRSPGDERHFRTRFHLGLNGLETASDAHWNLLIGHGGGVWPAPFILQMRRLHANGQFQVRAAAAIEGGGAWEVSPWADLDTSAGPLQMEVQWWAASDLGQPEGGMRLWVDEELTLELSGLANSDRVVQYTHLGLLGVPPGMTGELVLDHFLAWR